MPRITRSALVMFSAEQMFKLVNDVDAYPQFLPWCDHSSVLDSDDAGMTAEVGISFSGIRQTFTTRNLHVPDRQVAIALVNGPFSRLDGQWDFVPIGDGSQRACRVELTLNYGFDNAALGKLVGPVFDKIAASMVDAFVKRAEQVYGT